MTAADRSGDLVQVSACLRQVVVHLLRATPPGPARVVALNQARRLLAEHFGDEGYLEWDRVVSELVASAEVFAVERRAG